jgi:hypothetical protein
MPKTNIGKWSVGLIIAMFILLFFGSSLTNSLYESVSSGSTIFEDIVSRPVLAISMLVGFGAGISAFATGLIGIIKLKERSILVYISTIIGALLIVFLIMEFLFPH